ncbi:MAG: InlB B-repeat-containing protein [Candidatus Woesearchaeota archaeon]
MLIKKYISLFLMFVFIFSFLSSQILAYESDIDYGIDFSNNNDSGIDFSNNNDSGIDFSNNNNDEQNIDDFIEMPNPLDDYINNDDNNNDSNNNSNNNSNSYSNSNNTPSEPPSLWERFVDKITNPIETIKNSIDYVVDGFKKGYNSVKKIASGNGTKEDWKNLGGFVLTAVTGGLSGTVGYSWLIGDDLPEEDYIPEKEVVEGKEEEEEEEEIVEITPTKYRLDIRANGKGTTSPGVGNHLYNPGEEVTLKAMPDENWVFKNWSGAISSTNPEKTITMNGNYRIVAVFEEEDDKIVTEDDEVVLTITTDGAGSTSPSPGKHVFTKGDTVSITANPNSGHEFIRWSGAENSSAKNISITINDDTFIMAHFTEDEEDVIVPVDDPEFEPMLKTKTALFGNENDIEDLIASIESGNEAVIDDYMKLLEENEHSREVWNALLGDANASELAKIGLKRDENGNIVKK